jgi:enamine deaminase RidA (YjgF/YER057c/UK114 family)
MSDTIEKRLQELGIDLPAPAPPAASYIPTVQTGNLLFVSGQLPLRNGKLERTGLLGRDLDTAEGNAEARQCAINVLAQIKAAAGSLERVKKIVKLTVFVAATPDFIEPQVVANGASDLLGAVLGEAGRHARSAIGMAVLPLNAPVEVEAIVELA